MPNYALRAKNQKLYAQLARINDATVTRKIAAATATKTDSKTGSRFDEQGQGSSAFRGETPASSRSADSDDGWGASAADSPAKQDQSSHAVRPRPDTHAANRRLNEPNLTSDDRTSHSSNTSSDGLYPSSNSSPYASPTAHKESKGADTMSSGVIDRAQAAQMLDQLRDMFLRTERSESRSRERDREEYRDDRYREDRRSSRDDTSYTRDRGPPADENESQRRQMASLERKIEELSYKLKTAERKSPSSPEVHELRTQLAERNTALRAAEAALNADRSARVAEAVFKHKPYRDDEDEDRFPARAASRSHGQDDRAIAIVEALQIKCQALQDKLAQFEAKAASATKHQSMLQKEKNDVEAQLAEMVKKWEHECSNRVKLEERLRLAEDQRRGDPALHREVEVLKSRNKQFLVDRDVAQQKAKASHVEATKALDKVKSIRREADGLMARVQELESQGEEELLNIKEQLKASLQQRDEENDRLRKERRMMKEGMSSLREKYNILQRAEESRLRAEEKLQQLKHRTAALAKEEKQKLTPPSSRSEPCKTSRADPTDSVNGRDPFSALSAQVNEAYDLEKKKIQEERERAKLRARLNLANMELPSMDMEILQPRRLPSPAPYGQTIPDIIGDTGSKSSRKARPTTASTGTITENLLAATPPGQQPAKNLLDDDPPEQTMFDQAKQPSPQLFKTANGMERTGSALDLDPLHSTAEEIMKELEAAKPTRTSSTIVDPFSGLDDAFAAGRP